MRTLRRDKTLARIVHEGTLLHRHHGRYEAALFLLMHRVRWRLILRILAPLTRRRSMSAAPPGQPGRR